MRRLIFVALLTLSAGASATTRGDYLVQLAPGWTNQVRLTALVPAGSKIESLGVNNWYRVTVPETALASFRSQNLLQDTSVQAVEPNGIIRPLESPSLARARAQAKQLLTANLRTRPLGGSDDGGFPFPFPFPDPGKGGGGGGNDGGFPFPFPDPGKGGGDGTIQPGQDNPPIPTTGSGGSGADPMFNKQWGMVQNNVKSAWDKTRGAPEMIVAVIDTGVDYTHEDLVDNMWRNPGETGRDAQGRDKSSNGVDDDNNGYIDDVVGWDMVANDNKPFDKYSSFIDIISGGGNPGHGTHCAGNVAARADNGKGIAGVAPNIKIMALRFISEKGSGTTADAIRAIKYAVDNGAKVTSNSWGSEGEDANDPESKALRDAIKYAESKGSLFIAAAGNGRQGLGYDNDTDRAPGYPASYDMDIIVSVAAIDERGNLGSFSNWGKKSVDLAAPGVKVFSTVPGSRYQDTIGKFFGQAITWDGTSMATPHVAGAAALYWSAHPDKTWREVKEALIASVKKTQVLGPKVVSGGQLDVQNLLRQ